MELENIVANTVYLKAREGGSDSNKGKSKKWRKILQFPHISQCIHLKDKIDVSYGYVIDQQPIGRILFRMFCENKRPLYYRYIAFLDSATRYEIEYDENRLQIGRDIGRRFLGIECDGGKRVNDSGGGGGGGVGNTTTGNGNGEAGGNGSNENGNDDTNSEGKKNDNNKENTSKEINLNCEKDELVLDVLNDDLIEKVRGRLTHSSKEVFEPCITAVKSFLAGEPFSEFESSMYFHRYLQWKWLEQQDVTYKTFRMYRVLGKGGFGEVCACQVRATGKMYACKKTREETHQKTKRRIDGIN